MLGSAFPARVPGACAFYLNTLLWCAGVCAASLKRRLHFISRVNLVIVAGLFAAKSSFVNAYAAPARIRVTVWSPPTPCACTLHIHHLYDVVRHAHAHTSAKRIRCKSLRPACVDSALKSDCVTAVCGPYGAHVCVVCMLSFVHGILQCHPDLSPRAAPAYSPSRVCRTRRDRFI